LGWFSGKTSDLNPDAPIIHARNIIQLGGGSRKVYRSARLSCSEQQYQWCLELTEALNLYPEDVNIQEIIQLQVFALQKLASLQMSANGRNWYLTKSLEIQGLIDIKPSPKEAVQSILKSTLNNLFMLLPVNLDYKKVQGINQLILFYFNDENEKFSIHIRNGIADVQQQSSHNFQSINIDMIIEVSKAEIWKQVMAHLKSPASAIENGDIVIKYGNGQINLSGETQLLEFLYMFAS
jgi:alkyl sulfatase BDS1-like metallo-beta-lactamase superfamily hydrolase